MDFYRYAESELYRMADAALGNFVERAAACGVNVTTSVKVGDPGEVIVSEARERGSDFIVLGDACKGRSEEYKARINVGKLLRSAPCSVLQVKADARAKDAVLACEAGQRTDNAPDSEKPFIDAGIMPAKKEELCRKRS
jgi:hypothetical protein